MGGARCIGGEVSSHVARSEFNEKLFSFRSQRPVYENLRRWTVEESIQTITLRLEQMRGVFDVGSGTELEFGCLWLDMWMGMESHHRVANYITRWRWPEWKTRKHTNANARSYGSAFTNIVYLLLKPLPNTTKPSVFPSNRAGWSVEGRHSALRSFRAGVDPQCERTGELLIQALRGDIRLLTLLKSELDTQVELELLNDRTNLRGT